MNELVCFIAGIVCGFGSSAPIGPINLWVADAALGRRGRTLPWFLTAVILVDMGFAALAGWGYHAFLQEGSLARVVGTVGGGFLAVLGVFSLRNNRDAPSPVILSEAKDPAVILSEDNGSGDLPRDALKHFALGAFMTGSNPAFLMFWVFAIDVLVRWLDFEAGPSTLALFLGGVALGDGVWFSTLAWIVRRGRGAMSDLGIRRFRSLIAWAFIVLGAVSIVRAVWV